MSIRGLIIVAAVLAGAWGGCDRTEPGPPTVTIRGTVWQVELATTVDQRYRGLSERSDMPDGRGMLFIYPAPAIRGFCMRQCLIDLDIAFIGPDRRVVQTYTMTVEPDGIGSVAYSSQAPAQWVLETAAGALARAGVAVGDLVSFSSGVPEAAKAAPDK
jgi:uncharacterized membrane protein (UPF0127 family)